MTQKERDLMIGIARCTGCGCCRKIRKAQCDHNVFHLPEPWNGHLSEADILFVGTNPNYNAKEVDFPQDKDPNDYKSISLTKDLSGTKNQNTIIISTILF